MTIARAGCSVIEAAVCRKQLQTSGNINPISTTSIADWHLI